MTKHKEYLRRNLVLASAVGAQARLKRTIDVLSTHKRPPKGLIKTLLLAHDNIARLPAELIEWRDNALDAPK